MNELLLEYLPILVFFIIAIVMAAIFVLLPILVVKQKPDAEKLSAYECGFEAFTDMHKQFGVRFYFPGPWHWAVSECSDFFR